MDPQQIEYLVAQGNTFREQNQPERALECYAAAFIHNRRHAGAFNNYGNVLREVGEPEAAIPFLQRARQLDPKLITAHFNLSVAQLLSGNWSEGFKNYECRFDYEHLKGSLPTFAQPRWAGEDLKGKTILVLGEQGHGDNIQFSRFLTALNAAGAKIILQTNSNVLPLFQNSAIINHLCAWGDAVPEFDYWIPMMSLATVLGVTLDNLPHQLQYLAAQPSLTQQWAQRLGAKKRVRIGFCWTGRPDSWINQHKAMPFERMLELIVAHPEHEWVNFQVECNDQQRQQLADAGVNMIANHINNFADTAALMHHMDLIIGVDTAVSHLGGAMGRPTWVLLNQFALDWRWLLNRNDSPWYPSARLFRQPALGDWTTPLAKVSQHLNLLKI